MSKVSILSYLRYLHDVNRKLLQRGGLENVLYRKPRSQDPFYHQFDFPDPVRSTHWLAAKRHIQNADARGVTLRAFLGFGLVVGQLRAPKGNRKLSAPFAFCSGSLEQDDEAPNSVQFNPLWDTITLNYDLLTIFLGKEDDPEGEATDEISVLPIEGVGGPTLARFSDIEKDLERWSSRSDVELKLVGAELLSLMNYVRDSVPAFKCLKMAHTPFEHRNLASLIVSDPPTFFPHRFFFIAPSAGELTTMTALAELIRQSEMRGTYAV